MNVFSCIVTITRRSKNENGKNVKKIWEKRSVLLSGSEAVFLADFRQASVFHSNLTLSPLKSIFRKKSLYKSLSNFYK
jgi:hypothetical protein